MTSREAAKRGGRQAAAHGGRRRAQRRVIATEAAWQAVNRLRAARGPLMFVQRAGLHFVTRTRAAEEGSPS